MTARIVAGLAEVASPYDAFILDLWGVVHDGVNVFPGVIDALARLRRAGKRLVFLSNAPRRAEVVLHLLHGLLQRIRMVHAAHAAATPSRGGFHKQWKADALRLLRELRLLRRRRRHVLVPLQARVHQVPHRVQDRNLRTIHNPEYQ